ncbi:toll/interleukin-1 receptor domain-containing protein [Streptacidiphilus sp. P02-A3a]|uniref:toll/interleukin-1 receptor domain-containing protein n=1 Tax=Streptacidiphilus sp. P02-A3a TaxID=2704468 RepID=UPI0015FCE531|nr:toll/interleukin-1 receptor domain-containing protein [Streptacidiphilus sp. P02-A3a]QMU67072.1 toll/interleukin-1 receptor domain-containing protein [Streptacidiphilus sp. P02-A3a]
MPHIFINYRRETDAYAAALLDELLSHRLGPDHVFRAGRSIAPGADYTLEIARAIASCDAMLVVVGPGWHERIAARYPDQEDWVLYEIEKALEEQKVIVPVLLSGTPRIRPGDLPDVVLPLASFQYLRFDYRNTARDAAYMCEQLERRFPARTLRSRLSATLTPHRPRQR